MKGKLRSDPRLGDVSPAVSRLLKKMSNRTETAQVGLLDGSVEVVSDMALIVNREKPVVLSNPASKFLTCHTCKRKKPGLFDIDVHGRPRCGSCAAVAGRPIPGWDPNLSGEVW